MRPIIFAKIASMKYYKGITPVDTPENGGAYVEETGAADECYNFDTAIIEDKECCLGFAMLTGGKRETIKQMKIEKIVGCESCKNNEFIDDVTVVWCAKANGSSTVRVVGFYKHATVFREHQYADFSTDNGQEYIQEYNFVAEKENCVLLPYQERFSNSQWYVPMSKKRGSSFGFGRSSLWYAGSHKEDEKETAYVEKMIKAIDEYDGVNWIDERGEQ